ncbi:hypothetical protein [Rhodoferax sp. GW822-FHT02A01]|uniref:hypothetical protein n=1 Tax=Rhodoferax sp. GW822-FHT02A01 TaxID=3141537 RepID=UPI00315D186E
MTEVITVTRLRAGTLVRQSALPKPALPADPVAQQAAIENALSMALYFVRQPGRERANLWAATAKANRALTLLKHASQGITQREAANDAGRA